MTTYEQLKAKIQAANTAKDWFPIHSSGISGMRDGRVIEETIRLADVLHACLMFAKLAKPGKGWVDRIVELWNLTDDDLDHQSGKCKDLLIQLLCK